MVQTADMGRIPRFNLLLLNKQQRCLYEAIFPPALLP